jgi:hypothetical protein
MDFNDNSNTNTNDSDSLSSDGDYVGDQMVENFNKVKTGHKLDDYILSILNSENCKKKFLYENEPGLTCPSSDTMKVLANSETDDVTDDGEGEECSEVSDILYERCLPSHKLDDVLQVALKIVKPIKTHAAKIPPSSEKGKLRKIDNNEKLNPESTSKYICPVCKFVFNSEDSKNRHMSNEHIKRICKGKHPWKTRKTTSNQSPMYAADIHMTADIDAYSNVNNGSEELPKIDQRLMRKELRKSNWEDIYTPMKMNGLPNFAKDTGYPYHMSSIELSDSEKTCESFPCRVEISNIRNSDGEQCCRTKTFYEHMALLKKNRKRGEESNHFEETDSLSNYTVCHESDGNTINKSRFTNIDFNSFSSEESCSNSGKDNKSLSSSSAVVSTAAVKLPSSCQATYNAHRSSPQPPVLSVHVTSALLKEKHWIIDDASNFGELHSVEKKKQQGILKKDDDLVGIKSIDESHEPSSLTQCSVSLSDGSLTRCPVSLSDGSLENVSILNSKSSICNSDIYGKHDQVSIHSSTSVSHSTSTKRQSSESIQQEWKFACARHMTILDYLSNYNSFKSCTFKNKSSLHMEPSESQTMTSTKGRDISDSQSRDLIMSPPKKRWKNYTSHD